MILTPTKDKTLVRNGEQTTYTVSLSNDVGAACDVTNATVTLTLPARDGTPTGQSVTLAAGADYPAGTGTQVIGTVPYTVDVAPGVSDAVVRATVSGTLHDAPTDHAADVIKTLGTEITQPSMSLTKTASPASGEAPLGVTFTYTLTNDSSTGAPIANPQVTDEACEPVSLTGGDGNGNGVLDNGETWTYTCEQRFANAGTFTSSATATGVNTVDGRPVDAGPAQATVQVSAPTRSAVQRRTLPPVSSQRARGNAPCVAVTRSLRIRAGERRVVRVRVREDGQRVSRALVRITGPGFVMRRVTNERGIATFRIRPRRSGRLVIQSDRCDGADRLRVLSARRVSGRNVPRVTG